MSVFVVSWVELWQRNGAVVMSRNPWMLRMRRTNRV